MNSVTNALSVFTVLGGAPHLALELVAKCVNSPTDVLQFIHQLMLQPANFVEIINKFMNGEFKAMKMLSDMVNTTMVDSTTKVDVGILNSTLFENATTMMAKSNEISTSDIVMDTLNHTKSISNPIVQNLLESVHGDNVNSLRQSSKVASPPSEKFNENFCDEQKVQLNALESIISNAINIEYNINGRDSLINRELNNTETAKLNELIVAYKALFVPLDEDLTPLVSNRNEYSNKVIQK